jgi:hypothetical protein
MRTYEVWTLIDGERPALLGVFPHIARATGAKADWMRGRDPEVACAWVQCPERSTTDNPEGIWPSDLRVIRAAERLAKPGPVLAVACLGRDLSSTLAKSVEIVEGRAEMAGRFNADLAKRLHQQLTWLVKFPNIVRAARS